MKKKVVIIGLDGVPYSLVDLFTSQGIMPQFREIISNGFFRKMETSLPEVSSVAWASFMTGKNPGEHGIFGFFELKDGTYDIYFPNYNDVKSAPFWEDTGVPSVVLNVPQTYPARPLNGVMTSGFVALDLKKATYPDSAYKYLSEIGYKIDVNSTLAKNDIPAFFNDLDKTFEKRRQAINHFFDNEKWQIFVGTITETDRLHHFFYDSAVEQGKFHREFIHFYKQMDEFLGEIYRKAKQENALFITCSDHGFTPIKTEVYLNRWLMQEGYLEIADKEKGIESITGTSAAFCLDPSRIYIHLQGKYPKGCVATGGYEQMRRELKQKLLALSYEGDPVVKEVYFKEEIFRGPYAGKGPDLYALPHYGFDLKGAFNKTALFGRSHFTGMHTHDDAHFFSSEEAYSDIMKIEEIAPAVCRYMNGN
ncbi:MAG: alkaline phosphatase family protein [Nitrospirae bacterium]|nr:alkaline phosphatase family protein [Nitrospirota bacterium]